VALVVVLDAGPLGLASKPRGKPNVARCRDWLRALDAAGVRVVVPEVADYEVRRELIRAGATAGLVRLELLESALDYDPITTPAMRRAAELWATVRNAGLPTAHPLALDADCVLAAQALLLGGPDDTVTIATTNARHLTRFPGVDARPWELVTV
jgi:predicted nucleic acid-binding protein